MASPQNFVSKLTALVVDDNIINRKIHQKMLNKFGVKSQGVENGKEAVDIHWRGQKFDLILMDMDMPIMNGIEATKELRAMGICSTIVGVSSRSMEDEILKFMEAGLDEYQEKPLNNAILSSILGKITPTV
ncbi:two-component response regulator 24 [Medicago truncatula]|uniref:Response regulator receiver domain protein n=1 Tax=Medicago truncatula TaxID=3880 RepID=G7KZK5_MEDTR|nr:two-component response regulator 24 [Medicago truncatula]AES81690.1 response regulator receiver domain protein [Medicago truncatula]